MGRLLAVNDLCEYKPFPGLRTRRRLGRVEAIEAHHALVQPLRQAIGGPRPQGEAIRVPLRQVRAAKVQAIAVIRAVVRQRPPRHHVVEVNDMVSRTDGKPTPRPRPAAPLRSRAYLAYVRQQPCCSCGAPPPCHAHHHGPRAVGAKTDDLRCVPLCAFCHDAWHSSGTLPGRDRAASLLLFASVALALLVQWMRDRV